MENLLSLSAIRIREDLVEKADAEIEILKEY